MEIYQANPKSFSHSKRAQRFLDPRERRKTHPNGQQLRKIADERYYKKNSDLFTFEKYIRDPSKEEPVCVTRNDWRYRSSRNAKLFGQTEFEKCLNMNMLTKLNYSLNKHKNWERISSIVQQVEADEKCKVSRGKSFWSHKECDIIKLGYFDLNEMEQQNQILLKQQAKYEKELNYDVSDINNYIKDKFYESIIKQRDRASLKRWKQIQSIKPKNIHKDSQFLRIKSITARSIKRGCKIRSATTKSFGLKSFWSPIKADDSRDYIQVDLGKDCLIEAVSTRGRCLKRDHDFEIDYTRSYVEYVKRYRVYIKKDDNGEGMNHNKDGKDEIEEWISLGVFNGNRDSETEVANKLRLSNHNKDGVICRYLRVYPLGAAEGGYYGKKSMRIGVYGRKQYDEKHMMENEKKMKDKENMSDEDEKGKGDLIKNLNVPAAIITIKQPSETNNRSKNWAVWKMHDGVFACGCRMCSYEGRARRRMRKGIRHNFRKQTNKIKHVNDYSLDSDWIHLHPKKYQLY